MGKSIVEELLVQQISETRIPPPEREYQFHPKRKFRFDLAWPGFFVAAEVEGGVWSGGRHVRGQGFIKDTVKYNLAALLGWRVFRFPSSHVEDGTAIAMLKQVFGVEER